MESRMTDMPAGPRYGIDSYQDWLRNEGLPVTEHYGIDLFGVELKHWPRYDARGAAVHLKGRGDFANMFVLEIAPGASTAPQRHMYEDVFYVLEGRGSTEIELADGRRHSFEWGPKSLFAIPLNARHRLFNASGRERALVVTTTDLPLVLNLFHNERFVFENDFNFAERGGKDDYYSGEGDLITVRPGNHMWETNFVPDLAGIELKSWGDRGAGGSNIMFVLADGTMHAHISEMPVGTYKKGHRHGSDFHVFAVTGQGYSLYWYEGEKDMRRFDWKHGSIFAPTDMLFHQHFNVSPEPARYLAVAFGGLRYPTLADKRKTYLGMDVSVKEGGRQIEYEDEDPRIREIYEAELRKNGVPSRMSEFLPA